MQHRESVRARMGWPLLGLVAAVLVVLVLPVRQIGRGQVQLGGLIGSYLYEDAVPVNVQVSNLRCSDIYLPKTLRLDWDYTSMDPAGAVFEVQRSPDSGTSWGSLGFVSDHFWVDAFDFSYGTHYQYRVRVSSDAESGLGLPSPPPGADPGDVHVIHYASGQPWVTISVTPMQEIATDNQAVDSRIDPRYATTHYQNFPFGTRTYRGGLFAGYNADNARVGRSYLKFNAPALPSGTALWVATVNAFWVRNYGTGSVTVGCQPVGDSWTQSTVKWTTAPSVTPGAATRTVTVTPPTNPLLTAISISNNPWVRWEMSSDYATALSGDGVFSVALASTSESTNGWAYFAKKEYSSGAEPCVLYAYGN